jgi:hypothetical protein
MFSIPFLVPFVSGCAVWGLLWWSVNYFSKPENDD